MTTGRGWTWIGTMAVGVALAGVSVRADEDPLTPLGSRGAAEPAAPTGTPYRPSWGDTLPEGGEDSPPILVAFVEPGGAGAPDEIADVADASSISLQFVRFTLDRDALRAVRETARARDRDPSVALPSDPAQAAAVRLGVTAVPTYLLLDAHGNLLFKTNNSALSGAGIVRDSARGGEEQQERSATLSESLEGAERLLDQKRVRSAIPRLVELAAFQGWPQAGTAQERLDAIENEAKEAIRDALRDENASNGRRKVQQVEADYGELPGMAQRIADALQELSSRGAGMNNELANRRADEASTEEGGGGG